MNAIICNWQNIHHISIFQQTDCETQSVEKFWTRSCELTSVSLINSLMHRQLPDQSSDFPESFSVLGFTQRILLEQLDVSSTFSSPEDGIMSLSLRSSLHMAAIFAIASHIAEVLRPLSRETPSTTSCVLVDQIRKNQETQFKVVSFSRVHDGRQWEGNGQVRPRLEGGRHVTLLDSLGKSNVWDGWVDLGMSVHKLLGVKGCFQLIWCLEQFVFGYFWGFHKKWTQLVYFPSFDGDRTNLNFTIIVASRG